MSFDLSDHTLLQIGTWATVGLFALALWDRYGPRILPGKEALPDSSGPSGFLTSLWENKTLIVAVIGLAITAWLYLRQTPSDVIAKAISDAVAPFESKLKDETQRAMDLEQKLKAITDELAAAKQEVIEAKKTAGDPISVTSLPTHIRLQFTSTGYGPQEIEAANVRWNIAFETEMVSKICPKGYETFEIFCTLMPPNGDKNDFAQNVARLTIVFVRPIMYKKLDVNKFGAQITFRIKAQTDHFAIIDFTPDAQVTTYAVEVKASP